MIDDMALLLTEYNFNKSELARRLGVSPQAIANSYDNGFFSYSLAIQIEKLTDGKYKAVNLCKNSL
jgi:DNA-binding XRE family transcriptional regulator